MYRIKNPQGKYATRDLPVNFSVNGQVWLRLNSLRAYVRSAGIEAIKDCTLIVYSDDKPPIQIPMEKIYDKSVTLKL